MQIPLSIYIHLPWCEKKCPYCDFNSHPRRAPIPEAAYRAALLADLDTVCRDTQLDRPVRSIFFGGGTPSLLSAAFYQALLKDLAMCLPLSPDIEITLEANPGAIDTAHIAGYRAAGINRLSFGAQSFNDKHLAALGRIHRRDAIFRALTEARHAGFSNINLDIMFGLPEQTISEAYADIQTAIDCAPTHISWYQLTLEPNTAFYHAPPPLPDDDILWAMQTQGQACLAQAGYHQYEISAYQRDQFACQHNLNYWLFGDYIGLGAGAHGKLTDPNTLSVMRYWLTKHPKHYLNETAHQRRHDQTLTPNELCFEFMLNALRLYRPIPFTTFTERTGLCKATLTPIVNQAVEKGLLRVNATSFEVTTLGHRFLNDLQGLFLTEVV